VEKREEAIAALRRAKENAERTTEEIRSALALLEAGVTTEGPSQEDLGVAEQLRDIVEGGRRVGLGT
jgi:hypothetical protein